MLLGETAKYGLALTDNKKLTRTRLAADLLMIGLIAVMITDQLNIVTTNLRVFVVAL